MNIVAPTNTLANGSRGRSIAFLGSYPPRKCGTAAFTSDLSSAISRRRPDLNCEVIAVNDQGKSYPYPEQVRYQIAEERFVAYQRAADHLNISNIELLSVQHEYSIFGGRAGAHILGLIRDVRMPIVTTLHHVMASPSDAQRSVLEEVCARSERVVVLSETAAELLRKVHHIVSTKIDVIPPGIVDLPDVDTAKALLGLTERKVLLTLGLLRPDKGIEYVLDALLEITARHPKALYLVLGATHPQEKRAQGETYRLMLEARGRALGIGGQLVFHDRFVSNTELAQFMAAADIYITPYLNLDRTSSSTLALAVGSGKLAISTPYLYAQELLSEGRGAIVAARDGSAIASEVLRMFEDQQARDNLKQRALDSGKDMRWPVIAAAYLDCFARASKSYAYSSTATPSLRTSLSLRLPEINLDHLRTLTDDTGLLRHAIFNVPRREDGYCLDDNAQALRLVAQIEEMNAEPIESLRTLTSRYLAFVRHAYASNTGGFRNEMSYHRTWQEGSETGGGTEESHGRALWALGTCCARSTLPGHRTMAKKLFCEALPTVESFDNSLAWAYTLLGIAEYLQAEPGDEAGRRIGLQLSRRLMSRFRKHAIDGWPWCEDKLNRCSARLPQALLVSGQRSGDNGMIAYGLRSLEWLGTLQTSPSGTFLPLGSQNSSMNGTQLALFDRQPAEACAMTAACLQAYTMTGERAWVRLMQSAFNWFLGRNQANRWLYDASTGGCRDGLETTGFSENQSAESTLSFLMALLDVSQCGLRLVPNGKAASVGGPPTDGDLH